MSEIDWRARLIEVFVECLHDADFGQSGDDAIDIIHHIKKLRSERDVARAEALHLRKKVVRIEQLAERYDSDMNDAGRDIITRLRYETAALAIRAALKSEADHD